MSDGEAQADGGVEPVEWGAWSAPVRVRIEHAPVMLFARAVKDDTPTYSSERAALEMGHDGVPVPPTFTFVMTHAGAFPDLQPDGAPLEDPAAATAQLAARPGLHLHGEQHFEYHRPVRVGDVLDGRRRVSRPVLRKARRGPMEVTCFQTRWTDPDGGPVVTEQIVSLFFPEG